MATRSAKSATADEINGIEELIRDLEQRLRRVSGNAKRESTGATEDVSDFVNDALSRIMERMRGDATQATESLAGDAAKYGVDALRKLLDELEKRPLMMLGIAAGVGFFAAMLNKK